MFIGFFVGFYGLLNQVYGILKVCHYKIKKIPTSLIYLLAQFNQNAICGFRMKENHELVIGTFFRDFIQNRKAFRFEPRNFQNDIPDIESDVMDAFTFLLYEFGDRAFGIRRFEQFDLVRAIPEKRSPDAFAFDFLRLIRWQAEEFFENEVGRFKAFDGYSDVFDFSHNDLPQGRKVSRKVK